MMHIQKPCSLPNTFNQDFTMEEVPTNLEQSVTAEILLTVFSKVKTCLYFLYFFSAIHQTRWHYTLLLSVDALDIEVTSK